MYLRGQLGSCVSWPRHFAPLPWQVAPVPWSASFTHQSQEVLVVVFAIWASQSPQKCFFGMVTDRFPVKLQARELGADIAYCLRKAARVRNERISKGHKRLVRLAGLPLSRVHKQRMLLSSVFPQALHASETALVPKSVFGRLRSKTSLSLGTAKKGANPLLACLLACPKVVDPQFV